MASSAWSFWTTYWCCAAPVLAADRMSNGNTLYVPPKKFFDAPEWAGITDWAGELAPYIDHATRMLGVVRVPYMDTQADRLMREVAQDMGKVNSSTRRRSAYISAPRA